MNELIKNIPVVALRGMTLLPSMITHFDISREKSVKAVETAMLRDQKLVVVTQKSPETQDPGRKDLHKIGTLVTVKQIMKLPQNIFRVLAEGLERVEVMDLDVADGCLVADAATFSEEELALPDEKNQEAMVQTLRDHFPGLLPGQRQDQPRDGASDHGADGPPENGGSDRCEHSCVL